MPKNDYRLHLIKTVKHPFEYFKGQKTKVALENGAEYEGVLLNHDYNTLEFLAHIPTKEDHEKVILKIQKTNIKYIIENNKGRRIPPKKK